MPPQRRSKKRLVSSLGSIFDETQLEAVRPGQFCDFADCLSTDGAERERPTPALEPEQHRLGHAGVDVAARKMSRHEIQLALPRKMNDASHDHSNIGSGRCHAR